MLALRCERPFFSFFFKVGFGYGGVLGDFFVVGGFVTTMSWASVKLRVWGGLDHSVCVSFFIITGPGPSYAASIR